MKAVAYARFSSDNQREESVTAQLRAIREYAEKHGVTIVREYIDEAESATTDARPSFLRMIADLRGGLQVDLVLIHKFDRFARNRYDSAVYKREIQRAGERLVTVAQPRPAPIGGRGEEDPEHSGRGGQRPLQPDDEADPN